MKRYYYPNRILDNKILPFVIEVTTGLNVYYKIRGNDTMYKADCLLDKKHGKLSVSIDEYLIIIIGWKAEEKEFGHQIFKQEKKIFDSADTAPTQQSTG